MLLRSYVLPNLVLVLLFFDSHDTVQQPKSGLVRPFDGIFADELYFNDQKVHIVWREKFFLAGQNYIRPDKIVPPNLIFYPAGRNYVRPDKIIFMFAMG